MQAADQAFEIAPGHTIADELSWLEAPPPPDGYTYLDGAQYCNGLSMWAYHPTDTSTRCPTVVFAHGGGWLGGHPRRYVKLAAHLASHGYACFMPEYRYASDAAWPASVYDIKAAVQWVRANHENLGVDPDAIAAAGDSAGGHLAAMLALTPGQFEDPSADARSDVIAAVLFFPVTDMSVPGGADHIHELVKTVLRTDDSETMKKWSPLTWVNGAAPPILTFTGAEDDITPVGMIREFHDALDNAGAPNELRVYEGAVHGVDLHGPWTQQLWDLTLRFLDENLRRSSTSADGIGKRDAGIT